MSRDAASAGASAVGPSVRGGNGGMRTGVLIHGCHLGAKGWRSVMWGDEKTQRLGRLSAFVVSDFNLEGRLFRSGINEIVRFGIISCFYFGCVVVCEENFFM